MVGRNLRRLHERPRMVLRIGTTQVALEDTEALKIASALPAAELLIHELAGYRVKVSEDGKDSYGNGKEPANDDFVLELAIGVYTAARPRRRMGITHIGLEPPVASREPSFPDGDSPSSGETHGTGATAATHGPNLPWGMAGLVLK